MYLIVSEIPMLHSKIIVFQIKINIWKDHFFSDPLPDDSRHFITVHFHNWICNFDSARCSYCRWQRSAEEFGNHSIKSLFLVFCFSFFARCLFSSEIVLECSYVLLLRWRFRTQLTLKKTKEGAIYLNKNEASYAKKAKSMPHRNSVIVKIYFLWHQNKEWLIVFSILIEFVFCFIFFKY